MAYCPIITFLGVALVLAGAGGTVKLGTPSFVIGGAVGAVVLVLGLLGVGC